MSIVALSQREAAMLEVIYTVFVCAFIAIVALGHVLVLAAIIGTPGDHAETGLSGGNASGSSTP